GGFGDGPAELDASGGPDARWFDDPGPRASREDLRRVADAYFTGLERNDGHGDYPFADDCIRIENGFRTTNVPPTVGPRETPSIDACRAPGAKQEFEAGCFRYVTRLRERPFPVADEPRGVVLAFPFSDRDGTGRDHRL